ncbi:hypothetical protein [Flavobacterium ginsenosidimutans]|uniref:hypothetical protein n=1 Tax=Flavobacterium ginsenosidimutans TaxID=687844 RepID=UPI000DAE2AF4|nr:hypothetical protein [Flavobacterium ginsenosidimutans]KAF2326489.1 hypothetical protein DM444_21600 [Flavobacterium ginsenosidimutans]
MINKVDRIVLLIIKNVDEGEGASLKMINSSLNIIARDKNYEILFDNEFDLKSKINEFIKLKYIIINIRNNYELTELGKKQLKLSID